MENMGNRSHRCVKHLYDFQNFCGKWLSAIFCLMLLSSAAFAETVEISDAAVSNRWHKIISERAQEKGISREDAAKEIISEWNEKRRKMECNASADSKVKSEEKSGEPDRQMQRLLWLLLIILFGAAAIADKKIKEFAKVWIRNGEKNEKLYKWGFVMIRLVLCGALVVGAFVCIYWQVISTLKTTKRAVELHERWEDLNINWSKDRG